MEDRQNTIWTETEGRLTTDLVFDSFAGAMAFMVEASLTIEKQNHHPEWRNIYNKVHIELTTHDANNTVTTKDRKLAKDLEALYYKRK